jgi:transcriptional regulator with XRE-family HTH domain
MARVGAGFNQTDLAEKVSAETGDDISRTIVGGIESGKRDAEYGILLAIANICGVSRDWLTGDRDIPGYVDPWYPSPLSGLDWKGYLNPNGGKMLTGAAA